MPEAEKTPINQFPEAEIFISWNHFGSLFVKVVVSKTVIDYLGGRVLC